MLTWVQALFLFRFLNKILAEKAKRKESLIQNVFETSTTAASNTIHSNIYRLHAIELKSISKYQLLYFIERALKMYLYHLLYSTGKQVKQNP